MSQWRAPLLTLVLSAVAVAGVLGYRHLESTSGQTATTLQLSRLDRPRTGRLADWHGIPVGVNLFASWCPPCLSGKPAFEGASHDFAGRPAIVGVATQDNPTVRIRLARLL